MATFTDVPDLPEGHPVVPWDHIPVKTPNSIEWDIYKWFRKNRGSLGPVSQNGHFYGCSGSPEGSPGGALGPYSGQNTEFHLMGHPQVVSKKSRIARTSFTNWPLFRLFRISRKVTPWCPGTIFQSQHRIPSNGTSTSGFDKIADR